MRGRGVALVVVVTALLAGASHAGAHGTSAQALLAPAGACPQSGPSAVLCLVNWARAREGLEPLAPSAALARASRLKARDIVRCGRFEHDPCGAGAAGHVVASAYRFRNWSENLYWGERRAGTPRAAVHGWLESPTHRANMLGPFRHVGIGHRRGAILGRAPVSLWVLEVAQPM